MEGPTGALKVLNEHHCLDWLRCGATQTLRSRPAASDLVQRERHAKQVLVRSAREEGRKMSRSATSRPLQAPSPTIGPVSEVQAHGQRSSDKLPSIYFASVWT